MNETQHMMCNQIAPIVAETSVNPCIAFALRKATRLTTRIYEQELRPLGLRGSQYSLLNVIAATQPINFRDLAAYSYSEKTTIVRNCRIMERNGWIKTATGRDGRERMVQLTNDGKELLVAAHQRWQKVQHRLKNTYGRKKSDQLLEHLNGLMKTLERM